MPNTGESIHPSIKLRFSVETFLGLGFLVFVLGGGLKDGGNIFAAEAGQPRPLPHRSWIFFFFFSFSLSDPRISSPYESCGTENFPSSTPYIQNIVKEMELLAKLVSVQRFAAHTFGLFPIIYTLANCMEDLSVEDCLLCFAESRTRLPRCLPRSSGRIFLDGCFLRYDNYSFFEESVDPKLDKVVCGFRTSGENFNMDFSSKVDQVVNKVKDVALNNSGFGVAEVRGERFSVYALAQCWKTVSDCEECLVKAASGVKGCAPNKEGRGLNAGCYLRYSTEKFYNDPSSHGRRWLIWVLVVVPVVLTILIVSIFIWFCCQRRQRLQQRGNKDQSEDLLLFDLDFSNESNNGENGDGHKLGKVGKKEVDNIPLFSFTSVSAATDNFSAANRLGEGGFGPVYKGKLLKGQEVAAKRLSKRSGQGLEELRNEVVLIAKLQHKYLVRLLGCCIEGEEKILIYEYMPNKSLDTFLFDPTRGRELDWERRIHIVDGIAQGLLYLHQYSRFRIIHRDLKASNILLDGEMNPKISDFGLARIFGGNQSEANTARIVGTYGYMSPEYAMEGHFSIKSDVFSFGVLLLEIISGKKITGFYLSDCLNLLGYAWELWKNDRLVELMDSRLGDASSSSSSSSSFTSVILRYIHVAFLCVQESAADRPTMSDVCSMLKDELSTLPSFKQPAFSTGRSVMDENLHARKTGIHTVNDLTISNIEGR